MISVITGFTASVAHVVTGPDHLAAVAPLSIDSHRRSWLVGLLWGLGHTVGMLLIGAIFLLFREVLPLEMISRHCESIIGVLLIAIGTWTIIHIYRRHFHQRDSHIHFHTHPQLYAHKHEHVHNEEIGHEHVHPDGVNHGTRQNLITSFLVGVFHGFAGFSHLVALLPTLALPSESDAIAYLFAFATGTIITMMIFSWFFGYVAYHSLAKKNHRFLHWYSLTGGLLAIAVGVYWLIGSL